MSNELFSAEILDSDQLAWVWRAELEIHKHLLSVARSQLQQLDRCIKGEKVMDRASLTLSQLLQRGLVPEDWSGERQQKTIDQFLDVLKTRAEFYKVRTVLFRPVYCNKLRPHKIVPRYTHLTCGQSYKNFMLVNYDSRVVPDWKIPQITILES